MINNFENFYISTSIPFYVFPIFSNKIIDGNLNCNDCCCKFIWLLNTEIKPLPTSFWLGKKFLFEEKESSQ